MAADTISSYQLKNAYSDGGVSFDVQDKNHDPVMRETNVEVPSINSEVCLTDSPSKDWGLDVSGLISSKKWLLQFGLRKHRIDYDHLLSAMGFRLSDDFDFTMKKPIASRYGSGLFNQTLRPDGKTFNITADKNKLKGLKSQLIQAIMLYRRRLEWLTTESRRIFGVIEEKCIVIVLDIRNLSPHQFNQYRSALERVLREQVDQITKFNIIRATEDVEMYNKDCLPVTHDTIEGALKWLWNLDRLASVSKTSTCEAVVKALHDRNAEAVYLFTEGAAVDGSREILKEKISKLQKKTPVHVVSYNCTDSDTIHYLKELSQFTRAKFHAYAVTMEMDIYESLPVNRKNSRANIILKRKTYGGVPPGAGVREDVLLVFEELEAARSNLDQVQTVLDQLPDPKFVLPVPLEPPVRRKTKIPKEEFSEESREEYLSSADWLKTHGLLTQKLGLYDILGGVVFKHQDGVVNVLEKPCSQTQTDAVGREKLVNARYCDGFPVVRWKDGGLVHVQVSPEIHRSYEQKMMVALSKIQQRIGWLNQGSRELFGTVLEERIYILVDTSSSMIPHMQFVKDKIFLLLQEQLRHKMKFNLVSFNTRSMSWRDRLMDVTEVNLQSAWSWIQGLSCQGSTNTYSALQTALSDNQTQAIYLLTDGRPDQPPNAVIAQVQMQNRVPIHTISFNCNDVTANQFLCQLATATKGRFHYFNETGMDVDIPDKYESADIRLLKEEYSGGLRSLEQVGELRDQCLSLAWRKEVDGLRKSKTMAGVSWRQRRAAPSTSLTGTEFKHEISSQSRPRSAPPREALWNNSPPPRPSTALGTYDKPKPSLSPRMISTKFSLRPPTACRTPNKAAHTRTSLLRTLTSSGRFNPDTWLLPETKEVLDRQAHRQEKLGEKELIADPETSVPEEYKKFQDILEARGLTASTKVTKRLRKKLKKKESTTVGDEDLTVKQWLGRYGLTAKRLTILDALAPTVVPHKAKYIPILDKHVLAKVFNNVLPLAHVTGRDKKQIELINPSAVNLFEYEEKLQDAILKYIQFNGNLILPFYEVGSTGFLHGGADNSKLDQVVWDAIPNEAKTEFESEEAISFADNKIKMMKVLKESDWPITAKEITLLEGEITRAEKFLQQSRDLRRVAKEHHDKEAKEDQSRETTLADTNRSLLKDEELDIKKKSDDFDVNDKRDNEETKEQDDLHDNNGDMYEDQASIASLISREQELETEKEKADISEKDEHKKSGVNQQMKKRRLPSYFRNQKVIARKEHDGLYYAGVILKSDSDRNALIGFNADDEEEIVSNKHIIPQSGALSCPLLRVGDYVLVKVMNTESEVEVYIPGIVQVTPRRVQDSSKFYTVITYNAQRVTTQRSHLVKMTKVRFELCCRYIRQMLSQGRSTDSPHLSPSSSKDNSPRSNQGDAIEDVLQRLEDQQDQLEDHERKLRHQQNKLTRLKRKQRKQSDRENEKEVDRDNLGETGTVNQSEYQASRSDDDENTSELSMSLRRSLPHITTIGEEVLARWPDDGWYYTGTVHSSPRDSYRYSVEDCAGNLEEIWREDIITDNDCSQHHYQVSDAVIAAHPEFLFSYAPGKVIEFLPENQIKIQFYDGVNATLSAGDLYPLHTNRYREVVEYIQECDTKKIGQSVIARNNQTGCYQPGVIEDKVGDKSQFIVRWQDGSSSIQRTMYVFGRFTKSYRLGRGERVLALVDPHRHIYLPGLIQDKQRTQITIKFCDGTKHDVEESRPDDNPTCFWLSETFYDEAVNYFNFKSTGI